MERKQVIPSQSRLLQLYFIRHGETEWSLSGQHTGRTDIPLTARGEEEARKLGPCLREIQFARVLASPRQRARRTCELAGLGRRPRLNRTWWNGTTATTKDGAP
jgi:bisphosphoglycerate-dependent phosphoglycerate mutase